MPGGRTIPMRIARYALAIVLVLGVAMLVATAGLDRAFAHKEKHTPDQPAWP